MQNSKMYFKTLAIIHIALIAGQVIFAGVCIGLIGGTDIILKPGDDLLFFIVPGLAVAGLFAGSLLFRKTLEGASAKKTLQEKMNGYRSAVIIRYAMLEAPSLLAIVAYFLSGNFYYIFISGFLILYFLSLRPTKQKLESDLKLDYKEKEELERLGN